VAAGGDEGESASGAGLITMVRDCDRVCGSVELSLTCTEIVKVPAVVGVPEIVPPVGVSPDGTFPVILTV
jgi:hypothetical protein